MTCEVRNKEVNSQCAELLVRPLYLEEEVRTECIKENAATVGRKSKRKKPNPTSKGIYKCNYCDREVSYLMFVQHDSIQRFMSMSLTRC